MIAVSRRQVLGAGLVAGAGALTACSSGKKSGATTTTVAPKVIASASSTTCAPLKNRLSQIEHVVFLIQENRSFDHYFGSYRGVRGFDDHPSGSNGVFAQPAPPGGSGAVLPFHLDTATTNAACTNDINHDWGPQHRYWNGGAMDGCRSGYLLRKRQQRADRLARGRPPVGISSSIGAAGAGRSRADVGRCAA